MEQLLFLNKLKYLFFFLIAFFNFDSHGIYMMFFFIILHNLLIIVSTSKINVS